MAFELLNSEIVYPGRAFTIRRDTLRLPDGGETRLDIVEHVGAVVILPLDSDGSILFVRQYRHAAQMNLLELPAGTINESETPRDCAFREIREETGMAAGRLELLGGFFLAPGYSTEYMHVFLATDLYHAPLKADPDEFLSVERVLMADARGMCERGEIPDAKSLAALFLTIKHLERQV